MTVEEEVNKVMNTMGGAMLLDRLATTEVTDEKGRTVTVVGVVPEDAPEEGSTSIIPLAVLILNNEDVARYTFHTEEKS